MENETNSNVSITVKKQWTWSEIASVCAVLIALFTVVQSYTSQAVRFDRVERQNDMQDAALQRHDNTLQGLVQLDARLARIEARLDMLVEKRGGEK